MTLTTLPSGVEGIELATCDCGWDNDGRLVRVDRWVTDYPPIPRCQVIEIYLDQGMDPDDRVSECPSCGDELE